MTGIQSVPSEETAVPPPYPDFNLALFLSIGRKVLVLVKLLRRSNGISFA